MTDPEVPSDTDWLELAAKQLVGLLDNPYFMSKVRQSDRAWLAKLHQAVMHDLNFQRQMESQSDTDN